MATPHTLDEAVAALEAHPAALLLGGGTDLMPALNSGRLRPGSVVALRAVRELAGWHGDDLGVWLGAGLTFTQLQQPSLAALLPALARAAGAAGPPAVRNAATLGGNLGTAARRGDILPVLVALDAVVLLHGSGGPRKVPAGRFVLEPGRTALRPGELIAAAWVPAARGPQEFCAVRRESGRSLVSVALAVDLDTRRVRCAVGAARPVPVRATAAEAFLAGRVDWPAGRVADAAAYEEFGRLVATVAGSPPYARHAVAVCARRLLARALPAGPA
jgi:CO/xanthine dehydrogenase FAD-binding subunit